MSPRFDPLAQSAEHGIAVARVTDHRSPTKYGSYAVGGPFRMNFYPHLIGRLLQGAGFKVTGAGAGARSGLASGMNSPTVRFERLR